VTVVSAVVVVTMTVVPETSDVIVVVVVETVTGVVTLVAVTYIALNVSKVLRKFAASYAMCIAYRGSASSVCGPCNRCRMSWD
jgi:hypothetical protein